MKHIKIFSLVMILLLHLSIAREVHPANPESTHFHFTGKIGVRTAIEMDLTRIGDSLYGNYSVLPGDGNLTGSPKSKDLQPVQLYGKVKPKDIFVIRENPWDKGAIFTGKMPDALTLNGTWQSEDGREKYPFELTESYTDGAIHFNATFVEGSVALLKKQHSPEAKYQYCILTPGAMTDPVISDSLTPMIEGKFLGKPARKVSPDILLAAMKQDYTGNYISENQPSYDATMGASFSWESLKFMDVVLNRSHLLTFYIEQYSFTGGAHGMQTRDYTVVNLLTGRIIPLKEIFPGDYETALTELITRKVRQVYQISDDKKLSDNGFFVDEVPPTNNYYLTVNGIGFYYNHYEIAPYSNGPEDIFLTFDELKSLQISNKVLKELIAH